MLCLKVLVVIALHCVLCGGHAEGQVSLRNLATPEIRESTTQIGVVEVYINSSDKTGFVVLGYFSAKGDLDRTERISIPRGDYDEFILRLGYSASGVWQWIQAKRPGIAQ